MFVVDAEHPEPAMETTLLKGLRVLSAIAASDEPRGASDLARELGMTRSNAHRLVQTLAAAGFVKPVDSEGKYAATLLLFELGARAARRLDVWSVSYPVMSRLARQCDENVILATLERGEMVVIERIEFDTGVADLHANWHPHSATLLLAREGLPGVWRGAGFRQARSVHRAHHH